MELVGYIRRWPSGPRVADQEKALREAGCERIYVEERKRSNEPLAQRAYAIKSLRPGWKLVVSEPAVFGRADAELADGLREVHALSGGGAAVLDLSTSEECWWTDEAQRPISFIARGLKGLKTRQGQKGREAARGKGGRPKALQGKRRAAARDDWEAMEMSQSEIAEKYGVSTTVMHKEFGSWTGIKQRRDVE